MKILFIAIILTAFINCTQKPAAPIKATAIDTNPYFELKAYIESQIKEVNSVPYFIYKRHLSANRNDSMAIGNKEFNDLAKQFAETDLNDPSIKPFYIENVFHDATTKTYTLNYSTTNKELPVQNIDILLLEDAQSVKRIFMRRFYNYNDSSAIEQLSWKPNERFQINRLVQLGDGKETSSETIVVWNEKGTK